MDVCMDVCMRVCACVCVVVYVCVRMRKSVYTHTCLCVCLCVFTLGCAHLCVHAYYTNICIYIALHYKCRQIQEHLREYAARKHVLDSLQKLRRLHASQSVRQYIP